MEVSKRISEVELHIKNLKAIAKKHLHSKDFRRLRLINETIKEHKESLKILQKEMTCEIKANHRRNIDAIYY